MSEEPPQKLRLYVPESRHTLFMRGFKGDIDLDVIKFVL